MGEHSEEDSREIIDFRYVYIYTRTCSRHRLAHVEDKAGGPRRPLPGGPA